MAPAPELEGRGEQYCHDSLRILTSEGRSDLKAAVHMEAVNWLSAWGASLIHLYPMCFYTTSQLPPLPLPDLITRIRDQIVDFESCRGAAFTSKIEDLHACSAPVKQTRSFQWVPGRPASAQPSEVDWDKYWRHRARHVPELAGLACCLINMAASEAACERSMSIEKINWSKTRNRMAPDIVEAEMRIHYNSEWMKERRQRDMLLEQHDSSEEELD